MNALVGVRANATGLKNAPQETRDATARQVEAKTAARPAAVAKSGSADTVTREVKTDLDREVFLQLLVLQMQNQDPLDPVDNSQMIAQLAQFSALEQMTNLNESFDRLAADFSYLSFVTAGGLVGRNIAGLDSDGILREGAVERAFYDGGNVYLEVGDELVPLANLIRVE